MGEPTLANLASNIASLQTEMKGFWKRIDEQIKLSESVHDLASEIKVMNERQANFTELINRKLNALETDVKILKEKPTKRWDAIVGQIISLIIAMLFGLIMAKIGIF